MRQNMTLSDLNVEIRGRGNSYKKNIISKISIGFIEFLLSSVFYCYGVIFYEYSILKHYKYEEGIFTAIIFICSWSFTDPISRFIVENFDDGKHILFRYLIGCGVTVLFICIIVPVKITLYMCIGGIVSNLISTQLYSFAMDKLDMDPRIYETIRQVSRALSLVISPHIIFLLIANYEINQVKYIYGAILVNLIPAGLLVKTWDRIRPVNETLRYQTIGRYAYQLDDLKGLQKNDNQPSNSPASSSDEDESLFSQQNYFENKKDNDEHETNGTEQIYENVPGIENQNFIMNSDHQITELASPSMYLNPVNVQSYYKNAGVSILPGIPEENEDENDDINCINPKRLSMISDKLEELNIQEQKEKKDFIKEVFTINEVINENKPEPIDNIEYIYNFNEKNNRTSVIEELKTFKTSRRCFRCSPYRKYIWTRRLRMTKDFFSDNFVRPLYYALKNMYFYPCLTTKTTSNLVSTLYIILAPFTVMTNNFSSEEVTFILTYVGFAWGFFLVGLPLIVKFNPTKMRIMFSVGLLASGTSFLLLSFKASNDVITLSSLLFGFGYGLISYSEKIVYKSSIGMRPWYFVQGPLEVLSAILILIVYLVIYAHRVEFKTLLLLAALSYFVNALLWLCLPFMKSFVRLLSRLVFDERSQQDDFFH